MTPVSTTPPEAQAHVRDRAAAEAYVASVCFKHGPPRRLGVELEWIVQHADDPGCPLDPLALAVALGPHAPPSLDPRSPHRPLPAGSLVTVEPGGQVEISTEPRASLTELVATAAADIAALTDRLDAAGLRIASAAADAVRPPRRILRTPRYDAMHDHYRRQGPCGTRMMCGTAATQVCVDIGEGPQVAARWRALHAIGPALVAAFANSPVLCGERTGWASSRMAMWEGIDRGAPPSLAEPDPVAAYARQALDVPLLCRRSRDGDWRVPYGVTFADWLGGALPGVAPPTTADLDYHLTTVFPPVRPQGTHFEARYLDAQPVRRWALPVAVVAALLADDATTAEATAVAGPAATRWTSAARHGLADPVVRAVATELFELACAAPIDLPPALRRELALVTEHNIRRGVSAAIVTDGEGSTP